MAKTQDYKLGEFTFPRGWFVVAESAQIGSTTHCDRFFGEDVVLFRGASGKVAMLDAYCPHRGTHIGKNKTSHSVVQPALQIMQVSTDGPFGRSRVWYSQLYNSRAKAPQILARATDLHKVKGCRSMTEYAA